MTASLTGLGLYLVILVNSSSIYLTDSASSMNKLLMAAGIKD
jgi:hypothetical protein